MSFVNWAICCRLRPPLGYRLPAVDSVAQVVCGFFGIDLARLARDMRVRVRESLESGSLDGRQTPDRPAGCALDNGARRGISGSDRVLFSALKRKHRMAILPDAHSIAYIRGGFSGTCSSFEDWNCDRDQRRSAASPILRSVEAIGQERVSHQCFRLVVDSPHPPRVQAVGNVAVSEMNRDHAILPAGLTCPFNATAASC